MPRPSSTCNGNCLISFCVIVQTNKRRLKPLTSPTHKTSAALSCSTFHGDSFYLMKCPLNVVMVRGSGSVRHRGASAADVTRVIYKRNKTKLSNFRVGLLNALRRPLQGCQGLKCFMILKIQSSRARRGGKQQSHSLWSKHLGDMLFF